MRTASAYEAFPEFHHLDSVESAALDQPKNVDSEYPSHNLVYAKPLWWDRDMWLAPHAFDLSYGSVSSKEFAIAHRLKINERLLDSFEIRFNWLEDRDLEDDQRQQHLELIYWHPTGWGLSTYGSASLHKAENDIGFSLLKRRDQGEDRLFVTFADFQRNIRNSESDKFTDGRAPLALGYVSRRAVKDELEQKHWREGAWRWERNTHWLYPDQLRLYTYSRNTFQFTDLHEVSAGHRIGIRAYWDEKFEANAPSSGVSTVAEESLRRKRMFLRFENENAVNGHIWRGGVSVQYRDYLSHSATLIYRDFLPYLWWVSHLRGNERFAQRWQVGYDATLHWAADPGHLLAESPKSYKSENRLNVLWEMRFGSKATMNWIFTFDLDRFGTGQTWEGGCGQLQMLF